MKVRRFFLRLLPRLGIFVLSVLLLSVLTFYISRLAPGICNGRIWSANARI